MLAVLALLCLFFSWATYHEESPTGAAGAALLADRILQQTPKGAGILIVAPADPEGAEFAKRLADSLQKAGRAVTATVQRDPPSVRARLEELARSANPPALIATTREAGAWPLWDALKRSSPVYAQTKVLA